jgi:predicted transposase YdaD
VGEAVEKRNLEIAQKMKAKGKSFEEIADFTGLDFEQIKKL